MCMRLGMGMHVASMVDLSVGFRITYHIGPVSAAWLPKRHSLHVSVVQARHTSSLRLVVRS